METTVWVLRGILFVVLLGAINMAFTGSPVLGGIAVVAAVSLYWSLRGAVDEAS